MTGFDSEAAAGVRRVVGFVPVDSGTMVIADSAMFLDGHGISGLAQAGTGWVAAASGYGDGSYDVVLVDGAGGAVAGVEVVFSSPTLEAAASQAARAELGARPDFEQLASFWEHRLSPDSARQLAAYLDAERQIANRVWTAELGGLHPGADATARLLGHIDVGGRVGVGDPCYGAATLELEVPAGSYDAVAWVLDAGRPGATVTRLGIYWAWRQP